LPKAIGAPWEVAGEATTSMTGALGLKDPVSVAYGSSDSFGLAAGARIRPGESLLYLGTFFSIMNAVVAFEDLGPHLLAKEPFSWSISMPVGAAIDRASGHLFPEEPSTTRRIEETLHAAESYVKHRSAVDERVAFPPWQTGQPSHALRRFVLGDSPNRGAVAVAPVATFASALKEHCLTSGICSMRVTGGYAENDWLLRFLSREAEVKLKPLRQSFDAAGAARFAAGG
jgi:sugar (pentulose or hexulose) kinase